MAGVFISYRREDAPGHAGRIFDRVRARFGADVVFMDVTAIDAGADFVAAIEQAVGTCDVLLAIIGPQWAAAADSAGQRRLENPNDFIRLEIGGALKRQVRVVPVLVEGARLPVAADLPDDLQPLLRRNAAELRDARWDADIAQLISSLERIVTVREEPLRLEAPARHRHLRTLAALTVVVVGVISAGLWGPRACAAPGVGTAVPDTPNADVTKEETPKADAPKADEPKLDAPKLDASAAPKATVPNVVGRSLADAREALRRAGVGVSRILYRDDRTKAIDLVVVQTEVRTGAASPAAVALTVVARAAVVIHHRPEDVDVARRLLGALTAAGSTADLAVRTLEMTAMRPEAIARITYSDGALAAPAVDIAKDVNTWLQQNDPSRPALAVSLNPRVVTRTILIGLPDRGSATASPAPAPLPDVRGIDLADARRKLFAAGVTTFEYKWSGDPSRKPMEVIDQSEIPSRTGGRSVVLTSVAKGTLLVYYLESDAPIVDRLAADMTAKMSGLGVLVRPVRQSILKRDFVGTIVSPDGLKKEGTMMAEFASSWLTKELGRTVRIQASTDRMGPRVLTFWFQSLR